MHEHAIQELKQPRRLRKVFLWSVFSVLCLVIALTLGVWYAGGSYDRIAAEIRASGEPLTYADILFELQQVGHDQHSGEYLWSLMDRIKDAKKLIADAHDKHPHSYFFGFESSSADLEWPENQIVLARKHVAACQDILNDLRSLHEFPNIRLNLNFGCGVRGWIEEAPFRPCGGLSKLLYTQSVLLAVDGDLEKASELAILNFKLARPLIYEPNILPLLMHYAICCYADTSVAIIMNSGTVAEETLEAIDAEVVYLLKNHSTRWALLGERAELDWSLDPELDSTNLGCSFSNDFYRVVE